MIVGAPAMLYGVVVVSCREEIRVNRFWENPSDILLLG